MLKKFVATLLAVVMVLSLTACNGGKKGNGGESLADGEYKIADEYTELRMFYNASTTEDGEYEIFKEAAKYTNVYAKPTLPKSMSDFNQAFNLMIASGDIPDIVEHFNDSQFSKLGSEGAFVKLDEYLDIMPNYKKILKENPAIKDRVTYSDGHIYFVPYIPGGKVSQGWLIRQDWLDKLGLEVPTNVEEFYNVLKAFKTQDPNGNGKADEVPYFDQFNTLLALFDAYPDWYMDKNGKPKYGPAQPEYKTAITELKKWYDEGLIDEEILTGRSMRERRLTDNVGGSTHNWFGSSLLFNKKLKDKIPGFNLVAMLPPTGIEREQRDPSYFYGWGVSASSKNMEIAIKYLDFWLSDFGATLLSYGIEGVHYDMVDGKPKFKEELVADPTFQERFTALKPTDIGCKFIMESEVEWAGPGTVEAWELYEEKVEYTEIFPLIDMYLSTEDYDKYTKTYTEIKTYVEEYKQKWMYGSADLEKTYDEYIKQINKFGLEDMTKMVEKAIKDRK